MGVFGALLLPKTEDGVDTFGRVIGPTELPPPPPVEVDVGVDKPLRSVGQFNELRLSIGVCGALVHDDTDDGPVDDDEGGKPTIDGII